MKCPKCKKPLDGHHVIFYENGKSTHDMYLCKNCEHEWFGNK